MAVSHKRKFDDYYDKKKLLKRGAFGEAAIIISKQDGMKYVMKEEHVNGLESKDKRREEIKALRKCSHENIVKYYSGKTSKKKSKKSDIIQLVT